MTSGPYRVAGNRGGLPALGPVFGPFLGLVASVTWLGLCGLAQAQTDAEPRIEPGPSVQNIRDVARPGFDPVPLRFGSFLVEPQVQIGLGYDTNVFATSDDTEDDFFGTITPSISAVSQWSRHALSLDAFVSQDLYFDQTDEDHTTGGISFAGRLDYSRSTNFFGAGGITYNYERRGSPNDPGGDEPSTYWDYDANAGIETLLGPIRFVFQGAFERVDYNDVDGIDNDDRDINIYQLVARAGYAVAPRIEVFVQGTYDIRRYDQTPDDSGADRDSEGFALVGGVGFDITNLMAGEVTAGYRQQDYNDDALGDVSGFSFGGSLIWDPTTLTTVEAFAATTVEESTDPGSAGALAYSVGLSVDHELARNILVGASLGYVNRDYADTDRVDDVWTAGLNADYLANSHLTLGASYSFEHQDSTEAEDYTRNLFLLTATVRF